MNRYVLSIRRDFTALANGRVARTQLPVIAASDKPITGGSVVISLPKGGRRRCGLWAVMIASRRYSEESRMFIGKCHHTRPVAFHNGAQFFFLVQ